MTGPPARPISRDLLWRVRSFHGVFATGRRRSRSNGRIGAGRGGAGFLRPQSAPSRPNSAAPRRVAPTDVPAFRRSVVHHNPYPYPNYYENDATAGFRNPGGVGRFREYYPANNQFQSGGHDPTVVAKFAQGGGHRTARSSCRRSRWESPSTTQSRGTSIITRPGLWLWFWCRRIRRLFLRACTRTRIDPDSCASKGSLPESSLARRFAEVLGLKETKRATVEAGIATRFGVPVSPVARMPGV